MVIVKLKGGLGNQLFQYAFGRALAEARNDQLFFDLTYLTINPLRFIPREFKLKQLNNYLVADQTTLQHFYVLQKEGNAVFVPDDFPKDSIPTLIHGENVKAILLDGYFQEEFYFLPYAELIKAELNELLGYYYSQLKLAHDLINTAQETVSIHVRRGDYLHPGTLQVHGICELPYYKEALNIVNSRLENPRFYIFSDDPEQADQLFAELLKEKTNISKLINAQNFQEKDLIELYLMSRCKHCIMANSSYSWWGSYLSQVEPKLVIAPQKWYLDKSLSRQSDDIGLESWIRI